jgi:hypothetical protein
MDSRYAAVIPGTTSQKDLSWEPAEVAVFKTSASLHKADQGQRTCTSCQSEVYASYTSSAAAIRSMRLFFVGGACALWQREPNLTSNAHPAMHSCGRFAWLLCEHRNNREILLAPHTASPAAASVVAIARPRDPDSTGAQLGWISIEPQDQITAPE